MGGKTVRIWVGTARIWAGFEGEKKRRELWWDYRRIPVEHVLVGLAKKWPKCGARAAGLGDYSVLGVRISGMALELALAVDAGAMAGEAVGEEDVAFLSS